jgi:hydroxylaminobenzene mutase
MQAVLFMLGLILFLVGLLTGFAVPALKNPRMALSAYANWLTALLAAAWGAGRKLAPIATGDHQASAVKERRQFSIGVPFAVDRGRCGHRHHRSLKDSL